MKIAVDSDALIKLTKAGLKDLIVNNLEVIIPEKVYEETVKIPKTKGFPDALEIDKNVNAGKISVKETSREEKGEFEVVNLYKSGDFKAVVSDDRKFLKKLDKMRIPYLTPSSLILYLFYKRILSREDALAQIEKLRKYISDEEYFTSIMEVKKWER
jgi:hypothetical protein